MLGCFWSPEHTSKVYDDVFALIDDGARILREEIAELVRFGCPYIQIDAPELAVWDTGEEYAARFAELSGLPVQEMSPLPDPHALVATPRTRRSASSLSHHIR